MKKKLIFVAILFANLGFSQFTPTGTVTTDSKFRLGSIGLGYSTAPTWGTYRFMVNGDAFVSNKLVIGTPTLTGNSNYGFETNKQIWMQGTATLSPALELISGPGVPFGLGQFAVAVGNGNYSNNALAGDVVLRGQSSGSLIICNESAGKIKFATREVAANSGTSKVQMTIDKFGFVGIGTDNPDAKLAVNGLIHAKEVKVDLIGWPDFVFEKDFILPSLKEVEKQINAEGHLANIPSAKEVEENGVELGEMNKKLLQKIEELTLYLIQMNKKVELLENKLNKK